MNRRSFFRTEIHVLTIAISACLPFGLFRLISVAGEATAAGKLSLPGALKDDEKFIQACIGCGVCVEVCPHPSLLIKIVNRSSETITVHKGV